MILAAVESEIAPFRNSGTERFSPLERCASPLEQCASPLERRAEFEPATKEQKPHGRARRSKGGNINS